MAGAKYKRWSPREDAIILELRRVGATVREAALRVGRDEAAVSRRYERLGASIPAAMRCARAREANGSAPSVPWTEAADETLLLLRDEGLSYAAIGARVGRRAMAVYMRLKVLRERGLTTDGASRQTRWTAEEELKAAHLRNYGASHVEIAETLGRSPEAIETRLRLLNRRAKSVG